MSDVTIKREGHGVAAYTVLDGKTYRAWSVNEESARLRLQRLLADVRSGKFKAWKRAS